MPKDEGRTMGHFDKGPAGVDSTVEWYDSKLVNVSKFFGYAYR